MTDRLISSPAGAWALLLGTSLSGCIGVSGTSPSGSFPAPEKPVKVLR